MNATLHHELVELAVRVSQTYQTLPNLDAILLTGSVAKGLTDEVSDIDLMLYYRSLPSLEEFERLKQEAIASGGDIYSFDPNEGMACYHFIDGVKVDFAHQATADIGRRVSDFLVKPTVDDETTHIIMSGIVQGKILWGAETIVPWQEQLARLPTLYTTELIRSNLRFPPKAVLLEMGVKRHDYAFVYEILLGAIRRMLNVWCGLNSTIPPGKIKSCEQVAATLAIAPVDAAARLRRLWTDSPERAATSFYQLVDETLALVEQLRPDLDCSIARSRLALPLHQRT
ncbi:MAG: nucleotidyltransferase domain-containing protein [Caldilineaceae bacterium]